MGIFELTRDNWWVFALVIVVVVMLAVLFWPRRHRH